MGVTSYYSLDGEIIAEQTGAIRTEYSRDALGSVTATRSKASDKDAYNNTYRYKPYGARLAKTGTDPDPDFQHVGTAGYRHTGLTHAGSYVRRRRYAEEEGRWTTVDPLWPREHGFGYCDADPVTALDFLGMRPCSQKGKCCCCASDIQPTGGKVYRAAVLTPPVKGMKPIKDFTGADFILTFVWGAKKVEPVPQQMDACTMIWKERASNPYKDMKGYPPFDKYAVAPGSAMQVQMWNECEKTKCGGGNCRVWDGPGLFPSQSVINAVKKYKKPYINDVCIWVTFSSACEEEECGAYELVLRLRTEFKYPFVSKEASISVQFDALDGSDKCKPRANPLKGKV